MPDFSKMTDEGLRKFKSENHHKIQALRAESMEAEKALQALRAKADKEWAEGVAAGAGADAVEAAEAIVSAPPASADSESKPG